MFATHFVTIWSPDGLFLLDDLSDFITLECVLSEGNIGTLTLVLPGNAHDYTNFRRDARVAYSRAPTAALSTGQPRLRLVGGTTWLLTGRKRTIDTDQKERFVLKCVHPNHLLSRRVVDYDEGSAEADKSDPADDAIKAYVRENFTAATDTTRNWSSSLFTVDNDEGLAPSVDKAASYRTILNVCQEVAAAATALGTYTNFEVVGAERGAFRLRTYTGQRGVDRSATSNQTLILSAISGAFNAIELEEDWTDIATYVLAGGAGKKDERIVTAAWDTTLINESPYGKIEYFQSAGGSDDPAVVTDEANRALRERRPRFLFTSSVKDTEFATFMEEYDWGDRVVGEYARPDPYGNGFTDIRQFDCRVDPVRISVARSEDPETGEQTEAENLDIRLRYEP